MPLGVANLSVLGLTATISSPGEAGTSSPSGTSFPSKSSACPAWARAGYQQAVASRHVITTDGARTANMALPGCRLGRSLYTRPGRADKTRHDSARMGVAV